MLKKKAKILTTFFILSLFLSLSMLQANALAKQLRLPKLEKAIVTKHIDGDTIYVKMNNREYKVRLIGVNCPESTTKHEPYGKEASNYTKSKLLGKTVYLEKDVSNTDKYGRLLRYVWLQKPITINEKEIRTKMFNAILLQNGYAQIATYPPDVKYVNYFTKFNKEARQYKKGLWKLNYSTSSSDKSNKNVSTKSNLNKIVYWTPNGKSYHTTPNCRTLSRSKHIIKGTLKKAIEIGKADPCDVCN